MKRCPTCKKEKCDCGDSHLKAIDHEVVRASHPTNRRKGMTGHK